MAEYKFISGRQTGKWHYQLRMLKLAWLKKQTTVMYSGEYERFDKPRITIIKDESKYLH